MTSDLFKLCTGILFLRLCKTSNVEWRCTSVSLPCRRALCVSSQQFVTSTSRFSRQSAWRARDSCRSAWVVSSSANSVSLRRRTSSAKASNESLICPVTSLQNTSGVRKLREQQGSRKRRSQPEDQSNKIWTQSNGKCSKTRYKVR